jgi:hypothetical protein
MCWQTSQEGEIELSVVVLRTSSQNRQAQMTDN